MSKRGEGPSALATPRQKVESFVWLYNKVVRLLRRRLSLLLAFGLSGLIGIAPWLAKQQVYAVKGLLDFFPGNIKSVLIPASAFFTPVMTAVAQFYGRENIAPERLVRLFYRSLVGVLVGLILCIVLEQYVVPVGNSLEPFVIGWRRASTCGCLARTNDADCIKGLRYYLNLDTCWPSWSRQTVELAIELSYLLATGASGALIGLVKLRVDVIRRSRQAKARAQPSPTAQEPRVQDGEFPTRAGRRSSRAPNGDAGLPGHGATVSEGNGPKPAAPASTSGPPKAADGPRSRKGARRPSAHRPRSG
jgi:hypothetical protein